MARRKRVHLRTSREAAALLGSQIRQARLERRWTMRELAERADVSPRTLIKVERGDPSVALGTVFDAAALVGVPLFYEKRSRLASELRRSRDRAALLPQRVREGKGQLDDDF